MNSSTEATLRTMYATIHRYDLLQHSFYRAWSAGSLPVGALATYACEYGAFIRLLDRGWTTLDEPEGAAVERAHVELWNDFARALDTVVVDAPVLAGPRALVEEAERSFAAEATAAGALYAFEAQQASTARSKLEGIDAHYASLAQGARPYFEAHVGETGELAILEAKIAGWGEADQERAAAACERTAKLLWDALTSIHAAS